MEKPLEMNCYEYFVGRTEQYGDYVTVEHFGKKKMRSEFIYEVDCLASYFQKELGLFRGDVYTVFLPTCIQSFVAFYALNKIGVIINFVHPLTPSEVLQESMRTTGSKGIMILDILAKKYVDMINKMGLPCMVCANSDYASAPRRPFIQFFELVAAAPARKIKNRISYQRVLKKQGPCEGLRGNGNDVAVYLNGGGTTGVSKTIKLSSFAINEVVNKVMQFDEIRQPGQEALIGVLPLFHAFGLCVSTHLPLSLGARIIPMAQFNAKRFNAIMRRDTIMFIVGIPVMYRKLMYTKNFDGPHLKNLRLLFCGGDDVTDKALDEFNAYMEKWGAEGRLMRGYGLTEVASVCSANIHDIFRRDSIGKPLPGIRMEIWNEEKRRVPSGTIGEIAVSGSTMMEGYFMEGKPADEGVYTDAEGSKWVLTGDYGYEDEDGFFFFSGRKKRMILISGYNVYPTDIESKVEQLPFIKEVCAVRGLVEGKPIVKLYVSLRSNNPGEQKSKQEIFDFCETSLPHFSQPRQIIVMDLLPRTNMSKIDFMKLTDKEEIPKAQ